MFMCPWSDPYIVKRNMHRKQFLQIFFEFWSKCNSVWRKYFQRMFAQSLHFSELSCVWRTYHTNTLKLIIKDLFQITYFRHGRAILVGTEISCSCASVRIRVLLLGSFELYTKNMSSIREECSVVLSWDLLFRVTARCCSHEPGFYSRSR